MKKLLSILLFLFPFPSILAAQRHTEVTVEDAQTITGNKTFTNVNNVVTVTTKTAAGTQSAVTALQGAACANGPGALMMPAGKYAFGSTTVTVSCPGIHVYGVGKKATEVDYTGPGTAFVFSTGSGTVIYQDSIEGVYFNGIGDTTNQKIAIKLVDTSEFKVADVNVLNWKGNSGSGSTPSIGIDVQGRELGTIDRVSISADRPLYFEIDPNTGSESLDAWSVTEAYLLPQVSTESSIVIAPGSILFHDHFKGINCIGGASCVSWHDTTAVGTASSQISFEDIQHQQATGGSYSYDFTRSNGGAAYIQNLRIATAQVDFTSNGFLLQRTFNAVITNPIHPQAGGTALNADSTNFGTVVLGAYFQSGSTVTNNSGATSTDFNTLPWFQTLGFSTPTAASNLEISGGPTAGAGGEITGTAYVDMLGSSYFNLRRTAAASGGGNQSSPLFGWVGNCWTGSGSGVSTWSAQNALGSGSNPPEGLQFVHSTHVWPSTATAVESLTEIM